jgi:hypothetical protein
MDDVEFENDSSENGDVSSYSSSSSSSYKCGQPSSFPTIAENAIWKPPGIRELTMLVIDLLPEIPYCSQAFHPHGFLSICI